ncbi:MAG: lysozyme [Hyphomonadaceae bacterium]|nr:lysozyme [Hyphomonadaceae bacterium]
MSQFDLLTGKSRPGTGTKAGKTMKMTVSPAGLALLKRLEGFRAEAEIMTDGRALVGHGHVQALAPAAPVGETEAEALLRQDLAPVEAAITSKVLAPLTQAQFDALASFVFSIGVDAFAKSDVLRRLNAGEPIAAACAMDAWRKSRVNGEPQVIDALVRRRSAERAMFLMLDEPIAAPSAYVRAEIDHAASVLGASRVAAMPAAARPAPLDEEARRLADILARDPATAHALKAPPAPEPVDDEPLVLTRVVPAPVNTARDVTGLALLGIAGTGLFAAGLVALNQDSSILFLLFTAPGVVMMAAAGWQLLRDRLNLRWPSNLIRG